MHVQSTRETRRTNNAMGEHRKLEASFRSLLSFFFCAHDHDKLLVLSMLTERTNATGTRAAPDAGNITGKMFSW